MTEEIRKSFKDWYNKTIDEDEDFELDGDNCHYITTDVGIALAAFEHQQKRIDKLTTALKEIKIFAGGSCDNAYAMDSQLSDIWLKADEALKGKDND